MPVRAATLAAIVALCAVPSLTTAQAPDTLPKATPWGAKPVGVYEVEFKPSPGPNSAQLMPDGPIAVTLTIKESNDSLTAVIWRHGDNDGHPMTVATNGNDLILDAQTSHGALHVTLQQHGQVLRGSWTLGGETGVATGRRTS